MQKIIAGALTALLALSAAQPAEWSGLVEDPPQLRASDLVDVLGDESPLWVRGARAVHYFFSFDSIGARRLSSASDYWREWFARWDGGQCEQTVAALAAWADENGLSEVEPLTFVADRGDGRLSGHTIATVETDSGAVAFDTTFGRVFITSAPRFSTEVFRSGYFDVFAAGQPVEGYYNSPEVARSYYQGFARPRFAVQDPDGRLTAETPIYDARSGLRLGQVDGDRADLVSGSSEWVSHLGGHYVPMRHVWRLRTEPDQSYRLTYRLAAAESPEFRLDVTVAGESGSVMVMNYYSRIDVTFTAANEFTSVRLVSPKTRSRWLDAVTVVTVPQTSGFAVEAS